MRRGFEPSRGLWTMPGGFVDLGESVEEAAIRETKEEIGVDIEIAGPRGRLLSKHGSDRGRGVRGARAGDARRRPRRRSRFKPSGRRPSHGTSWRSGATVARCATTFTQRRRAPPPQARPDRAPRARHPRRHRRHARRRLRRADTYTQSQELSIGRDRDLRRPGPPGRARPLRAAGRLGRAVRGRDPAAGAPARRPADGRPQRRLARRPGRAASTCRTCAARRATRSPRTCAR